MSGNLYDQNSGLANTNTPGQVPDAQQIPQLTQLPQLPPLENEATEL